MQMSLMRSKAGPATPVKQRVPRRAVTVLPHSGEAPASERDEHSAGSAAEQYGMIAYVLAKARMGVLVAAFDWHADRIDRDTPVTRTYRNTQNVRRFLVAQCGPDFRFDRPFMAWIKDGAPKTMGDVADEWLRRQGR